MTSVSQPFIARPIATTLLMVGLTLAGLFGLRNLPVSALPQVDYPTIVVATYLPGASAETMASGVTAPLERQFGQMPSLSQMTSVSSFGNSQITLQFDLDRNIDAAQQDVQAAINAASSLLPRTLPIPPTYSKSNPADAPILTLAVSSDTLPLREVDDYADSILAQKISQLSGVGLVTLNGAQKPAVRVQVDPEALAGRGLTLEDVRLALGAANVNQPKGSLEGHRLSYSLSTDDQLFRAHSFDALVIAYKSGSPVRLGDIAQSVDGVENDKVAGWVDGERAVILNVQRQPGANVIEVADRVKALLPQLAATLPQGLRLRMVNDRTDTVRASVHDVEFTLGLTVALVVLVIFVFLRNLRATSIPGVTVPLSLIGSFGAMYLLGYSLNGLTLMALTISTGFVVDDAIVMIENISRYLEAGDSPVEAALKGSRQIGFTIISLTVSLVAVLIPLLFMAGVIGRLFREFAVTLGLAVTISALLSLTLTPMMCAHLLRSARVTEAREGRWARRFARGFEWLLGAYDRGLRWVLGHQLATLLATLGTLGLTVWLAVIIPKGFIPLEDTGLLLGITEAAPDVSFPRMMTLEREVMDTIRRDPGVAHVTAFIGVDGTNPTTNSGRIGIALRPHGERRDNADQIMARLRPELAKLEGVSVYLQSLQDLSLDNRVSRTQFQYTLEDADPAELALWAPRLLERLRTLPELVDTASDLETLGPETAVVIDRDTAGRVGVSAQAIDDTLYDAFGQRQISTSFTQLNLYRVILEVKPEYARDPGALSFIYVRSSTGDPSPLGTFTHFVPKMAPLAINHQGQFPAATLSFNLASGVSLGEAVEAIGRAERGIELPRGIHPSFQGTAQAFRTSLESEPFLILAALVTVYIVLGILYESYVHPITILSSLPSAGVGALLALLLVGMEFSVIALIGVILLIGIVKKNAIMMIDFALEAERTQGLAPLDAIYQACLLRFRPIMMTTAAALLGALPLAFGTGVGSELRRPLGVSIVGGLLISQVLTLFTTPVIYLYLDRLGRAVRRRRAAGAPMVAKPSEP